MNFLKCRSAFTLVEIMIVVAIIALLTSIAIPNLLNARITANEAAAQSALKTISSALENYAASHFEYPTDTSDLTTPQPPYLTVDFFNGVHNGYSFQASLLNYEYTVLAIPASSHFGNKSFTMTTGAVIVEN